MHLLLQGVVDVLAVHLEHGAQCRSSTGTGFAMAFGGFFFQRGQRGTHCLQGLLDHFGRHLGLGQARRLGGSGGRSLGGQAARGAQLVGPDGHGRQGRIGILGGSNGLGQGRLEGLPHHQQLGARCIQQRRETRLHADPTGIP